MKTLILALAVLTAGCSSVEKHNPGDMDPIRVGHVDYLYSLIQEYKAETGRYPLQSRMSTQGIQVFITHREINAGLAEQAAGLPVDSYTSAALESDIEVALGRDIELPSDPQNVATYAPNVTSYHVTSSRACVAGHLFAATDNSKNINNQYHKYERCLR